MSSKGYIHGLLARLWAAIVCALLLVACSSGGGMDDLADSDGTVTDVAVPDVYLSVRLLLSDDDTRAVTRASEDEEGETAETTDDDEYNPYGGEDGNGREAGVNNESVAHNVTLLMYQDDNGINSTDADKTTIDLAFYFDDLTEGTSSGGTVCYESEAMKLDEDVVPSDGTWHLIVIANAGDLTALNGKSLADVRDYLVETAWKEGASIDEYDYFVMSSESEGTLAISTTSTGSKEVHYIAEASVERLAARIDIVPGDGTYNTDGTYTYTVTSSSDATTTTGYFVLSSVVPFNCLNSGEYLIKRVSSDGTANNVSYLGAETMDDNKAATNYVLDPWTLTTDKGGTATPASNLSYLRPYSAEGYSSYASSYPVKKAGDEGYYILTYTLENTFVFSSEVTDVDMSNVTGLAFIGTYYTTSEWNSGAPAEGVTGEAKTYTYYIRHSDPTDSALDTDPMKYGIVRNNIYRVRIDGVKGEEETQETSMKITLNVRNWAYYKHDEIVM